MILLSNLQRNNNNLINYPIKFLTTKFFKSWNNEFEKTTLFWLQCFIFWVEFQFQDKPYSIFIFPS
jgi:hypothetical protein